MMPRENSYLSYFTYLCALILGYVTIGILVKYLLYSDISISPIWDIEHYLWIKDNGYKGFRVVFFPLFPWLWRFTNLSLFGISIFNLILFLTSSSYFAFRFNIPKATFLLLISIFSSLFYVVPYSESVFFTTLVFSSLAIEYYDKRYSLGFLFASISRPASTILIPASVFMYLLNIIRGNDKNIALIAKYLILSSGIGIILIMILNQINTGNPISFYLNQKIWASELAIPTLPLRSWGSGLAIRLDFFALSTVLCFVFFYFKNKAFKSQDALLDFCLGYVLWFLLITLAFRGGSLHSFNRFIFCTPFYIYLGYKLLLNNSINLKTALIIYLSLTCLSFLANSYVHIRTFLWFQIPIIYLITYIYCIGKSKHFNGFNIFFLVINGVILNILLMEFYSGNWIA